MRKGCKSGPVFGKQEANAALRLCVQLGMIVMPAAAVAAAARVSALERRMDDFAQQHEARQRAIEDGLRLQHERIDALQVHHRTTSASAGHAFVRRAADWCGLAADASGRWGRDAAGAVAARRRRQASRTRRRFARVCSRQLDAVRGGPPTSAPGLGSPFPLLHRD